MNNVAPGRKGRGGTDFGRAIQAKWLPWTVSLGTCKGEKECNELVLPAAGSYNKSWPLQCHESGPKLLVDEVLLDP
jgi:hypothetical protein